MIFNNYDRSKLPGGADSEAVDISSYLLEAHQGSLIIITRSLEIDVSHRLPIKKLDDLQNSLGILASSSECRDLLQVKVLLYEGCKSDERQILTLRGLRGNLTGCRLRWRQLKLISTKRRQSAVRTIFATEETRGLNRRERIPG